MRISAGQTVAGTLLLGALAAGCSILGPAPAPNQYFSLAPLAEEQRGLAQRTGAEPATYALGPIKLPAYLDRDHIVTRLDPTQLRYSEVDYWAGTLRDNVQRVMQQNFRILTGDARLVVYPWPAGTKFDYQVEIDFLRFETTADSVAHVEARWTITDGRTQQPVVIRQSQYAHPTRTHGTAAAVAGLSTGLGDLCMEIAQALRGL